MMEKLDVPVDHVESESGRDDGTDRQNGTDQDERDMARLGQKQQLHRNFSWLSLLALNVVLGSTWYTWLTTVEYAFLDGGRAGAVWTYLACWSLSITTVLSLAEMASIAPTAGGQYHWVSIFAPTEVQKLLSYLCGWLSSLGWQTFAASAVYATGNLILTLASTANPSYQPTKWQGTLITLMIAVLVELPNIFAARRLPLFERCVLVFFFCGFLAVLLPLWILAPKATSKEVWSDFGSYGGWSNLGLACVIGQLTSGGSMIGVDGAVHMAEEVRNASLVVPWTMVGTVLLGPAMGFAVCLTVNYCLQNVQTQIADSTAVYPFIGVFEVAVGSNAGAIGMTSLIVMLSFCTAINSIAAASRETWAFARDGGFPKSRWWARVMIIGDTPVPVFATLLANWFTVVSALLNIAGSEVYDAIIALCTGAVCSSYVISIGSLIHRRLFGKPLPPRQFSLGRAGLPLNIIAFFYNIQLIIFGYFPILAPVTATNMNYGSIVYAIVIIAAILYYLSGARKTYRPPVKNLRGER